MSDKKRSQTAQQKLNNFLRSDLSKTYPLCATKRLILHALASYCYYKDECDPSIKSIQDYSGLKDKITVIKHLIEIAELCLITIIKKNGCRNKYLWEIPSICDEEIYRKKGVDKSLKAGEQVRDKKKPVGSNPTGDQWGLTLLVH